MPAYFKFKTLDAIRATVDTLGLDVRFADSLDALWRPIEIAGRSVGGRLAILPMEGCDATREGNPDALTLRRYERFGAGGAKLIWGEACAVVPEGRANPRQLVIHRGNAAQIGELATRARQAHQKAIGPTDDLLVGLQLTHSGRWSCERPIIAQADPLLDFPRRPPSPAPAKPGPTAHLISDTELEQLQDAYVEAARLARDAGFDFIDLKQCHRYLLNELLAARRRQGRFGGSFENRTRFILELVDRIRDELPDLIIATRLNLFDGLPFACSAEGEGSAVPCELPASTCWGTNQLDPSQPDLAEPIRLVGLLRDRGVALVNATLGNPYASPHLLRPFEYAPVDGYQTPEHPLTGVARHLACTRTLQRAFPDLPVMGSGYSWLQQFAFPAAAAEISNGGASLVGIGRGSLAQPEFAQRLRSGQGLDTKRICRTFSYCTTLMRSKEHPLGQYPTGCPPFDKPGYAAIWKERQAQAAGSDTRRAPEPAAE